MIGVVAAIAGAGLFLWAMRGKSGVAGQPLPGVQTESPIQFPRGATPATLPGKGKTTSLQAPVSKMQYWVTTWPQDAQGRSFAVAQAVNDPMGTWVSFYVNPSTGARSLFAFNPPPADQSRRDFNFIA